MLRKRIWPALVLIMPLALAMGACGDDDDNGNGGGTDAGVTDAGGDDAGGDDAGDGCEPGDVSIAGTAALHPVAAGANLTGDFDGAEVALEAALPRISGNPQVLTAGEDCSDAVATLDSTGAFSFDMVDVTPISAGLISVVEGADFVTSIVGLAQPPIEDMSDATAYAVPNTLEQALAAIAGEDLAGNGFILGMFIDAGQQPVDGVTVVDGSGNVVEAAIYPSALLDAEETDGDTSPNGVFIIPASAVTGLGNFGGSSDGGTTVDFDTQPAATSPGTVFQMFLGPAN